MLGTMKAKYERWEDIRRDLLADPAVRKEYDRLKPQYELIRQLISARLTKKMTQAEIAKRAGTGQSAISRFESGSYNPSFKFLEKIAAAVGKELVVSVK